MTEHVMVAIWRAPTASLEAVAGAVLERWAPEALTDENVEECIVSFAETDQGIYARQPDARGLVPNCDALISLGLTRAHDLDDVPERDALHPIARRVEAWRVDTRRPLAWERDWADGEYAPGVKMVSFMQRADALTHEQFSQHWTENHTPLALRHHVGLWNYTQNIVRRSFTPGGNLIDGIAELHFRTQDDFVYRFFDSDDGRAAILADVGKFMSRPRPETALMRELPLKTQK
jgi:uncharacterized protein (TIGR02118 family)